ncbi:hypothetical protein [Shewanella sp.]|uniref:hypothetical protein n=1 Tax=Shewanella sp. TaxID=50422 RepID=UPI003F4038E9
MNAVAVNIDVNSKPILTRISFDLNRNNVFSFQHRAYVMVETDDETELNEIIADLELEFTNVHVIRPRL